MRITPLFIAATLAGCTTLQLEQPPAELEHIHMAVKSRITYQKYAKKDWRYIAPDTTGRGNCAVYAYTVFMDAAKAWMHPEIKLCRLPDGTGHAYTRVGDWVSDNRFKRLIPASQQDCK